VAHVLTVGATLPAFAREDFRLQTVFRPWNLCHLLRAVTQSFISLNDIEDVKFFAPSILAAKNGKGKHRKKVNQQMDALIEAETDGKLENPSLFTIQSPSVLGLWRKMATCSLLQQITTSQR
jgi:hypothetical protein